MVPTAVPFNVFDNSINRHIRAEPCFKGIDHTVRSQELLYKPVPRDAPAFHYFPRHYKLPRLLWLLINIQDENLAFFCKRSLNIAFGLCKIGQRAVKQKALFLVERQIQNSAQKDTDSALEQP